jgi:hypothetical protein
VNKKEIVLTEEVKEKREFYYVVARFDNPWEGNITVAARSADHARELVMAQMEGRKNFKIIDIFCDSQLPPIPELDDIEDLFIEDMPQIKKNVN